VSPNKPGTYLVLRSTPARPRVRDFTLETRFRSEDSNGGVGLVFRYQNPFEFYFFLMEPGYRLLGRRRGANFSALSSVDTSGFAIDTDSVLRLEARGPSFEVFLDGASILTGTDTEIVAPGRVGFMTWNNTAAFFRSIYLAKS
jgi:hypothetical protein